MRDINLRFIKEIFEETEKEFQAMDFGLLEKNGIYKGSNGWSMNYPGTLRFERYDPGQSLKLPDCLSNLYVSLPFCSRRCSFCTIISDIDVQARKKYFDALFKEMGHYSAGTRQKVGYVDLGGGTATMLLPEELDALMHKIKQCFDIGDEPHVCFEGHPELARQEHRHKILHVAKQHKIPNIAFGVQTFDEELLRRFNRGHDVKDVWDSVRLAKKFLPSFSIDLICGLENQSIESVKSTIIETIRLNPPSIDLYTYVNSHKSIDRTAENRKTVLMTLLFINVLTKHGWYPHRISADVIVFKKNEHMEQTLAAVEGLGKLGETNLLGVGNGAFSFMRDWHATTPYDMASYISNVDQSGTGISLYSAKNQTDLLMNYIKDSLRRYNVLDLRSLSEEFGIDAKERYGKVISKLESLGLLNLEDGGQKFKLTKLGFIYNDKVISYFFPIEHYKEYYGLEKSVRDNPELSQFYEEICNSPFNFELTPEAYSFLEKDAG